MIFFHPAEANFSDHPFITAKLICNSHVSKEIEKLIKDIPV